MFRENEFHFKKNPVREMFQVLSGVLTKKNLVVINISVHLPEWEDGTGWDGVGTGGRGCLERDVCGHGGAWGKEYSPGEHGLE